MEVLRAFNLATMLLFGMIWLGIVLFLRLGKRKSAVYLLFFTVFFVYMYKVLDITLLQFQLQFLQFFMPGRLMLKGSTVAESINLIPLLTLRPKDIATSLLNILLLMPFGFGLPFITNLRMKKVVSYGALLSIVIELLQLLSGVISKIAFRFVDVNDVIFNTLGAALGYLLFVGFMRIFRRVLGDSAPGNPILNHIAGRPQIDNKT